MRPQGFAHLPGASHAERNAVFETSFLPFSIRFAVFGTGLPGFFSRFIVGSLFSEVSSPLSQWRASNRQFFTERLSVKDSAPRAFRLAARQSSYSPELNPDELLNQDVKTNALGRVRPVNVQEMMDNVRSYLRITQARPRLVKNYFRERHVQYAAR
jgi:hypothetical protein